VSSALPPRLAKLPVRELGGGLRLTRASTLRSRQRGLGGLDGLAGDRALEISTAAVHTFTMRFALDLIWRGADGRVLRVDRDVARWRVRGCRRARSVIETAAGGADAFLAALADGEPCGP
jgi:uncharacterized membrane protein (UPF0127 family)